MSARRFTGDDERRLCAEYVAGATTQELADRYESSRQTVARTLERNGVTRRGGGRKPVRLTAADRDEIARSYQAGATVTALAERYATHYMRIASVLRERGVHLRPRSWKGGRTTTSNGYVQVLVDDGDELGWQMATSLGYVMEHRLVMARHLGRPLRPTETVHHINGDKTDNRLENLQLRQGRHGNGVVLCCGDCGSLNLREVEIGS